MSGLEARPTVWKASTGMAGSCRREGVTHAEVVRFGSSSRTRVTSILNGNLDQVSSDAAHQLRPIDRHFPRPLVEPVNHRRLPHWRSNSFRRSGICGGRRGCDSQAPEHLAKPDDGIAFAEGLVQFRASSRTAARTAFPCRRPHRATNPLAFPSATLAPWPPSPAPSERSPYPGSRPTEDPCAG